MRTIFTLFLSLFVSVSVIDAKVQPDTEIKIQDSVIAYSGKSDVILEDHFQSKVNLRFDSRFDGQYEHQGESDKAGFIGQYLKFILDGTINDDFKYSMRYRLYTAPNLYGSDESGKHPVQFFHSIDWANITWNINNNFFINAGKQAVGVGGYEYDLAPIDGYFWSDFWNNVNPYQIGVLAGYTSDSKKHTIQLQFTNSTFSTEIFDNKFSYSSIWYGNFGWFKTIYSINMMEYEKGKFINYIALGNRFQFNNFTIDFDYMNRAGSFNKFFSDFSVICNIRYDISDKFTIFAKGGYDQNKAQNADAEFVFDRMVVPGTEYGFYGLGAEYYPIKNDKHSVRVHAFWASNTVEPAPLHTINIGVKWQMYILKNN